jgi:hypothetical protein
VTIVITYELWASSFYHSASYRSWTVDAVFHVPPFPVFIAWDVFPRQNYPGSNKRIWLVQSRLCGFSSTVLAIAICMWPVYIFPVSATLWNHKLWSYSTKYFTYCQWISPTMHTGNRVCHMWSLGVRILGAHMAYMQGQNDGQTLRSLAIR